MKRIISIFCVALCCISAFGAQDILRINASRCREMALEQSYDVRKSINELEAAGHQKKEALSNYFPSIKGSTMVAYSPENEILNTGTGDGTMSLDLVMNGMYMAGFQLTQPIFAGGRIVNGHKMASLGEDMVRLQQRQIRARVASEAMHSYWSYVAVRGKISMLESYIAQLEELADKVRGSVELEMATQADLLRVQSSLEGTRYQLQRAVSGCEMCRMALSNAIGIDYDSVYVLPEEDATELEVSYPDMGSADLNARPEMQLLERQVTLASLKRKLTIGEYLPSIGLVATYNWIGNASLRLDAHNVNSLFGMLPLPMTLNGTYNYEIERHSPMVAVSITVPITDWGKGAHAIKRSRLAESNAKLDYEKNSKLMDLQLRQAQMNLSSGKSLIETSTLALESAQQQLSVMQDRYDVGLCTLTDLLSSQSECQKALSDKLEAVAQWHIYEVDYLLASGILE